MTSKNYDTQIAIMAKDIEYIKQSVEEIKDKLERDYVTIERYSPVEKIIYATASTVLLAMIGAVLTLILK